MLTEIYISALLIDEDLADQVWEAWVAGEIHDLAACLARWWMVVSGTHKYSCWPTIELWSLNKNDPKR